MNNNDFINVKVNSITDGVVVEDVKGVVVVGRSGFHKALDESFLKHKVGDSYRIELTVDEAFGHRRRELFKMISGRYFRQNELRPVKGLLVDVDGLIGKVASVSPGRVMVDFNHPLAGKDVTYDVMIDSLVTDELVKVKEFIKSLLGQELEVKAVDKSIVIKDTIGLPKSIKERIEIELSNVLGKTLAGRVKFEEIK